MDVKIESAHSKDEVLTLLVRFGDDFPGPQDYKVGSLEDYAQKLFSKGKVLIARRNGEDIGFTSFYCNDLSTKVCFGTFFVIDKRYRSLYVAGLLLDEMLRIAAQNGMHTMRGEVYVQNTAAIPFFTWAGFRRTGPSEKPQFDYYERNIDS